MQLDFHPQMLCESGIPIDSNSFDFKKLLYTVWLSMISTQIVRRMAERANFTAAWLA